MSFKPRTVIALLLILPKAELLMSPISLAVLIRVSCSFLVSILLSFVKVVAASSPSLADSKTIALYLATFSAMSLT